MLIQNSKGQESFGRAIHWVEVTTNLEWAFYFSSQITALLKEYSLGQSTNCSVLAAEL